MALPTKGYVVETPITEPGTGRQGFMRHWVWTQDRAESEAAKVPGRTWREVPYDEMPEGSRAVVEAGAADDSSDAP